VDLLTTSPTLEFMTMKEREAKDRGEGVADTIAIVEGRGDSEAGVEAEAGAKASGRLEVVVSIEVEARIAVITEEGVVEVETTVAEGEEDPAKKKMRKYIIALKRKTAGHKKKKKKRRFHSLPTSWKMLRHCMSIRTHFGSPPFAASDSRGRLDPLRGPELHKNKQFHQQLSTNGSVRNMAPALNAPQLLSESRRVPLTLPMLNATLVAPCALWTPLCKANC
jgi:hypothetical protein